MGPFSFFLLAEILAARASISIADPGDYADLAADATDNALLADYSTDDGGPTYQIYDITGPYFYSNTDVELDHAYLYDDANDTSVVVGTEGAMVNISYTGIVKYGYSTWLNQASFFGVNAAVNIANGSISYIDHVNITTHNGSANIWAYGTGSIVYLDNADLYSSGPTAHGLYAAGNGTIYASNVRHYSGGNRCSSFSGDKGDGYLYVTDAVAHTAGIGSAIFYSVGESYGENIVGVADNAPSVFSDGPQKTVLKNVDFTAGLLAGTVLFSSQGLKSGASISFEDSSLTVKGEDAPGLWFGNIIADASIISSEIVTESGILVIANMSRITPEFNHFVGVEYSAEVQPAQVTVLVEESTLDGDIVAYNGSSINWSLTKNSNWTGAARIGGGKGAANFSISIDESSTWVLTGDVDVHEFTNGDSKLDNIISGGHSISYNPSASANSWLRKKSVTLQGGGRIKPSGSS
ncbi:hypothetical protein BJX99DRAFT_249710 [Aspergillus californicus]